MKIFALLLPIFLVACSVALTKEGSSIRLVSEKERNECEFLGVVTGSMSMGMSTGHDAESAMNEVRNKAAQNGANGLRVLNTDSDAFASTVTAEALRCPF